MHKPKNIEINQMLTMSTAHISEETATLLDNEPTTSFMNIVVYPKGKVGWIIYIDSVFTKTDISENIPTDLLHCCQLANDMGCDILCLDRDGETIPYLETFNW